MNRLIFLLLLFSVNSLFATTYKTINSGNWEDSSTWVNGLIPPTPITETVIISEEHTVVGNVPELIIKYSSGKLNIKGILRTNNRVIVRLDGELKIEGRLYIDYDSTVSSIKIESGGKLIVSDDGVLGVNGKVRVGALGYVKNRGAITATGDVAISVFSPIQGNDIVISTDLRATLPIELISFNVSIENDLAKFFWITAVEVNNDYFTIEQSTDLSNWDEIHNQFGAGNSFTEKYYEVSKILHNMTPVVYFRLKQTDYDGKFTYSEPISLVVSKKMEKEPTVNVSNDGVIIDGYYQVLKVYNVQGRLVATYKNKNEIYDLPKGELLFYSFDNKHTQKIVL